MKTDPVNQELQSDPLSDAISATARQWRQVDDKLLDGAAARAFLP